MCEFLYDSPRFSKDDALNTTTIEPLHNLKIIVFTVETMDWRQYCIPSGRELNASCSRCNGMAKFPYRLRMRDDTIKNCAFFGEAK
jgi:hypothetical protein